MYARVKGVPIAPLKIPGVYLYSGPWQICCALRCCFWQFGPFYKFVKLISRAVYIHIDGDGAVLGISQRMYDVKVQGSAGRLVRDGLYPSVHAGMVCILQCMQEWFCPVSV